MPKFQKADEEVYQLAKQLIEKYEGHQDLISAKVRIDIVFAYGPRDDNNKLLAPALKYQGVEALGIARKISLKDRSKGMGDAEISLDADWWEGKAMPAQRVALLDHELHHIAVARDLYGLFRVDDLMRPIITLRKHDWQFGWFDVIAKRHGINAIEVI